MFLSVSQLAERWAVREAVVYQLRYRGEAPPAMKVGRELRFAEADVIAWETERRDAGHRLTP
jgi:predicted DNA-binding transcriptional regulator AlpA